MALSKRIIPTLLVKGRQLCKGKTFNSWRSVGVAAQAVRIHQQREVDEICILDVMATKEGRGPDLSLIEELSSVLFSPLSVGGGISNVEHVRTLLLAGADKVVIGTAATPYDDFILIRECVHAVGSQAITVSIDYRGDEVFTDNGTVCHPFDAIYWAVGAMNAGAGEILLTSIDREGTSEGYDLDMIKRVTDEVDIPVIAHGGCGSYEHMAQAIRAGASAVAAGSMFQFTDQTPREAAEYLQAQGIEART